MSGIISDDIGSFPLPQDAGREDVRLMAARIASGKAENDERKRFNSVVGQMMERKIASGVMRPNFPQVTDMIGYYAFLMENFSEDDEPYLVEKKRAVIPELSAIHDAAKSYKERTGEMLQIRVCVTGPLELYLKTVGGNVQEDLLMNMAKSVSRFVENSIIDTAYMKTAVFSVDEPGLGLNPAIVTDPEALARAWEMAMKKAGRRDVEIHLHSVNAVDIVCKVDAINVIGVEYAASPKALDLLDKREMESYDKFLRVGVARTDITRIVPEYLERFGEDLWKTKAFSKVPGRMENARNIRKRLRKAYELFGDRIRYAGPDCGLGSWPGQDAAYLLLRNSADAIYGFDPGR